MLAPELDTGSGSRRGPCLEPEDRPQLGLDYADDHVLLAASRVELDHKIPLDAVLPVGRCEFVQISHSLCKDLDGSGDGFQIGQPDLDRGGAGACTLGVGGPDLGSGDLRFQRIEDRGNNLALYFQFAGAGLGRSTLGSLRGQ